MCYLLLFRSGSRKLCHYIRFHAVIYIDDSSDERHKTCCIHCGVAISNVTANRDHVPSKSLLSRRLREQGARYDRCRDEVHGYLPQVVICECCNSGFSRDENYLFCTLHAVLAGSLHPDPKTHPEAANVLRSNRDIVRALKKTPEGQLVLLDDLHPFTVYPEPERMRRVVLKNARGHAYHELGEPPENEPALVVFAPLLLLDGDERDAFEDIGSCFGWPEVGSRMTLRVSDGIDMVRGWIEVERGRYRYAVDWSEGVTVRTVIWEYLATETHWAP